MERIELRLPADFETYSEARRAGFLQMKERKEQGARVVGMFCSFVPTELIYAAGALPVGLCAFTDEPIPAAEANLPRNLCPLIKASYGFALTDTCPYFYFSDFVVGETTCDGKKKMFELLGEIKDTYVMQLPHSRDRGALAFWREQIVAFQRKLEEFYGITITEADIREAIRRKNRERAVMRGFLELALLLRVMVLSIAFEEVALPQAVRLILAYHPGCCYIEPPYEKGWIHDPVEEPCGGFHQLPGRGCPASEIRGAPGASGNRASIAVLLRLSSEDPAALHVPGIVSYREGYPVRGEMPCKKRGGDRIRHLPHDQPCLVRLIAALQHLPRAYAA